MKVFNGIPPAAGHQRIQQGPEALIERARHLHNGMAKWLLFEARSGIEDG